MSRSSLIGVMRSRPFLTIVVAALLVDLLIFSAWLSSDRGVLRVAFLDVGQGDAVFIEAPNGNQLLYDAGPPSGAVLRGLGGVMPFWDRSIDAVMLSHPDMDHVGGFPEVFRRYDIDLVLEPGAISDNGAYDAVASAVRGEGAKHLLARKGMTIDLGGGVVAEVLYPDRETRGMDTNAASIVLRVSYGETAFLFSGDLPNNIEEYEVATLGSRLRADVLKLGHHGSRTSSSKALLQAVAPKIAVISAGKDNRYGHPHSDVIERLREFGIAHVGTYDAGTVVFVSDGERVLRE